MENEPKLDHHLSLQEKVFCLKTFFSLDSCFLHVLDVVYFDSTCSHKELLEAVCLCLTTLIPQLFVPAQGKEKGSVGSKESCFLIYHDVLETYFVLLSTLEAQVSHRHGLLIESAALSIRNNSFTGFFLV